MARTPPPQIDPLPASLARAIDQAANGGRVSLGTVAESALFAAGVVGGISRRPLSYALGIGDLIAFGKAAQAAIANGGVLGDVVLLDLRHRRQMSFWRNVPIVSNPYSTQSLRRIAVLAAPHDDVALVLAGVLGDSAPDADIEVAAELVSRDDLAAELAALAYRDPVSTAEAEASPGTDTIFEGPDRKAPLIATRVVHEWGARRAVMHQWAYTLFAGRQDHDWVGRRPLTVPRVTEPVYAKDLRWRLGKVSP